MLLIFGLDKEGKKMKKALLAAEIPKETVKERLLFYKKIRKNLLPVTTHYHEVREIARRILAESREVEQMMVQKEVLSAAQKARMKDILADFTGARPKLDFAFLISKADKDIHLTLDGMEPLGKAWLDGKADPLILQSEVENLIALLEEALEKEKPDLSKLAVFYINHTDRELEEISYTSCMMLVEEIYQTEYCKPLLAAVQKAMDKGFLDVSEGDAQEYLDRIIRI